MDTVRLEISAENKEISIIRNIEEIHLDGFIDKFPIKDSKSHLIAEILIHRSLDLFDKSESELKKIIFNLITGVK